MRFLHTCSIFVCLVALIFQYKPFKQDKIICKRNSRFRDPFVNNNVTIGIISVCLPPLYSQESCASIQAYANLYANVTAHCHTIHQRPQTHPKWEKVIRLRQHEADYDWLLWMDCDADITDYSRPPQQHLSVTQIFGKNWYMAKDWNGWNTGVFWLRGRGIHTDILRKWDQTRFKILKNASEQDQAGLKRLGANISEIPSYYLNSYPYGKLITRKPLQYIFSDYVKYQWFPGDWIRHNVGTASWCAHSWYKCLKYQLMGNYDISMRDKPIPSNISVVLIAMNRPLKDIALRSIRPRWQGPIYVLTDQIYPNILNNDPMTQIIRVPHMNDLKQVKTVKARLFDFLPLKVTSVLYVDDDIHVTRDWGYFLAALPSFDNADMALFRDDNTHFLGRFTADIDRWHSGVLWMHRYKGVECRKRWHSEIIQRDGLDQPALDRAWLSGKCTNMVELSPFFLRFQADFGRWFESTLFIHYAHNAILPENYMHVRTKQYSSGNYAHFIRDVIWRQFVAPGPTYVWPWAIAKAPELFRSFENQGLDTIVTGSGNQKFEWPTIHANMGWLFDNCNPTNRSFRDYIDSPPYSPVSIYLQRTSIHRRGFSNDDEVFDALKSADPEIERYTLENMSYLEQAQLFKHVKRFVSIHGAGLANMLYMPKGSQVVEIMPGLYDKPTYRNLATCLELNYTRFYTNYSNSWPATNYIRKERDRVVEMSPFDLKRLSRIYTKGNFKIIPKNKTTLVFKGYDLLRLENYPKLLTYYGQLSHLLEKIIIAWNNPDKTKLNNVISQLSRTAVPIVVVNFNNNSLNNGFAVHKIINTTSVINVDDDIFVSEYNLNLLTTSYDPSRIVCYDKRYYNNKLQYLHKPPFGHYSNLCVSKTWIIATRFLSLYMQDSTMTNYVDAHHNCEDIMMNFLVQSITKKDARFIEETQVRPHLTGHDYGLSSYKSVLDYYLQQKLGIIKHKWKDRRTKCVKWAYKHFIFDNITTYGKSMPFLENKTTLVFMGYDTKRLVNYHQLLTHYGSLGDLFDRIIIAWSNPNKMITNIPENTTVPIIVWNAPTKSLNNRFNVSHLIRTESVISVDDDIILSADLLERLFYAYDPERIVGTDIRGYNSEFMYLWSHKNLKKKHIKMTLTKTWIIATRFLSLYMQDSTMTHYVDAHHTCEDIMMNFLVHSITKKDAAHIPMHGERQKLTGYHTGLSSKCWLCGLWPNNKWKNRRSNCVRWAHQHFNISTRLKNK